jgi:hypothetical protein
MLFLLALLARLSLSFDSEARVCFYNTSGAVCPPDSTERIAVDDWSTRDQRTEINFGLHAPYALTYYLTCDLSLETAIHLPSHGSGQGKVSYVAVGVPPGARRQLYTHWPEAERVGIQAFIRCEIHLVDDMRFRLTELTLVDSIFDESVQVSAPDSLDLDISSALHFVRLTANSVTIRFDHHQWAPVDSVIRIGADVPVRSLVFADIDFPLGLRLFGGLLMFERPDTYASVSFEITQCHTTPRILLEKANAQLSVSCELYTNVGYNPIVEIKLDTDAPLIFEDSAWPSNPAGLVLITVHRLAGQTLFVRTARLPASVWVWPEAGVSEGEFQSALTLFADTPNVTLFGVIETGPIDLRFDSHLPPGVPVELSIAKLRELQIGNSDVGRGVFAHILRSDMLVRLCLHEKMRGLSEFSGDGRWEWLDFPAIAGFIAVRNLFVRSERTYSLFFDTNKTDKGCDAPLSSLDGSSSITFSDSAQRVLRIRPQFLYPDSARPTDEEIAENWGVSRVLLSFSNVSEPFSVELDPPEIGASGFERATYFFDFVWEAAAKTVRMVRKGKTIGSYAHNFCYAGSASVASVADSCPPSFAVIRQPMEVPLYLQPSAKQLQFAILDDFNFCPVFDFLTNTAINISVVGCFNRFNFTVPIDFLHGTKFCEIRLSQLTLKFNATVHPPLKLSYPGILNFSNMSFDRTVLESLAPGGCANTRLLSSDPSTYTFLVNCCVPEVLHLNDLAPDYIIFGEDVVSFEYHYSYNDHGVISIPFPPDWLGNLEISHRQWMLYLSVAANTTRIPRTRLYGNDRFTRLGNNYRFRSNWTFALASNLTIDCLPATFSVTQPFLPFRPGNLSDWAVASPSEKDIDVFMDGVPSFDSGVRVLYPFPYRSQVNSIDKGELLRFEDITLSAPFSYTGLVCRALFAGSIRFGIGAGINVRNAQSDNQNLPTIEVEFRLQGALPRLELGLVSRAIRLIHRGPSEKEFIQRNRRWFQSFSHDVICGVPSCFNIPVSMEANESEDSTEDHVNGSSVLQAVCRFRGEKICLALEVDERRIPLATPTPPIREVTCDIGRGSVVIDGPLLVECNGDKTPRPHDSRVAINGTTTANRVLIVDANLALRIDKLSITTQLPFLISSSSVSIAFAGASTLTATAPLHAGLECADLANISLSGSGLTARGGARAVGIGAGVGLACGEIVIVNGSYSLSGGTGLGSGFGGDDRSSVRLLRILGGRLEASGSNGAGIGAGAGNSGIGRIAITNGTVTAIGVGAAGIGSGDSSAVGEIVVENGAITANGTRGAGIGAGPALNWNSSVVSIAILGGGVNATGNWAAGIGSGFASNGSSSVRSIAIVGGWVRARGCYGSGIGAGDGSQNNHSSVGTVVISGGVINARGEWAAGIGGGSGLSHAMNLTIVAGNVSAIADNGAGIGGGYSPSGSPLSVTELSIFGGSISAFSASGAGIGAGLGSWVDRLAIHGGNVTAVGDRGAGIGAGASTSSVRNLTIAGGWIRGISASAAGIGAGACTCDASTVESIAIAGGSVEAEGYGGAGIGAGNSDSAISFVANVTLSGGTVRAIGSGGGIGFGSGTSVLSTVTLRSRVRLSAFAGVGHDAVEAREIAFENASVTVTTDRSPAFAKPVSADLESNLVVLYWNATANRTEPLSEFPGSLLQIGDLSLPVDRKWNLTVSLKSVTRIIEVDPVAIHGLTVSVFGPGAYRVVASSGGFSGPLVDAEGSAIFPVNGDAAFFPIARLSTPALAPVLTRVSPPSWGVFPAAGPLVAQEIRFNLSAPDPDQEWTLFWRFDAESWRMGALVPQIGENTFVFPVARFTGTHIRTGAHTVAIMIHDTAGSESNVISVSYSVATNAFPRRAAGQGNGLRIERQWMRND